MTPKDKVEELINKYIQYTPVEFEFEYAKQCALIAVEEILGHMGADRGYAFWTEVKEEIEKL